MIAIWWILGTALSLLIGVAHLRVLMAEKRVDTFDAQLYLAELILISAVWPIGFPVCVLLGLGYVLYRVLWYALTHNKEVQ